MKQCEICADVFDEKRFRCPSCGTINGNMIWNESLEDYTEIHVAYGAERARQLPESPRKFELCD